MGKETIVFQAEDNIQKMKENNFRLLFTTHGFKLMGIVTWDKMKLDESQGVPRRWIKGLRVENGTPLLPEERVFETSLHRVNPSSGQLEDIVAHEDDFIILMERKTFDLSDDDENFQFMPNMHMLQRVQQLKDQIEAGHRRLSRIQDEKEESVLDAEHFKREAQGAKERERTQRELLNRLTRENSRLQEKIGNLESAYALARAKNIRYEAQVDEITANAQEEGTLRGMTTDDLLIHAAQKKKDLYLAMHEIEPETSNLSEQMQGMVQELDTINEELDRRKEQPKQTEESK